LLVRRGELIFVVAGGTVTVWIRMWWCRLIRYRWGCW
jgi:hypothetical protein